MKSTVARRAIVRRSGTRRDWHESRPSGSWKGIAEPLESLLGEDVFFVPSEWGTKRPLTQDAFKDPRSIYKRGMTSDFRLE
jgi:hypothetical protein